MPSNMNTSGIDYDHIFYLRIFEGCNLYCSHCFIPSNPKQMSLSDVDRAVRKIESIAKPGQNILIQWHGGEPTLLGHTWMRSALESFSRLRESGICVKHGMQTNLTQYSSEWALLYREYFDGEVGVSWDPGIRHIKTGKKLSNVLFEEIFWNKIREAVNDGLSIYLVVTATKVFFERFRNAMSFIEKIEKSGIRKVHIERLTKTGYARDNWDSIGVSNKEYSRYMTSFYRTYTEYDYSDRMRQDKVRISPFDGIELSVANLLRGGTGGYGCLSGVCDNRFHTLDASGYKEGCTALTSESDNKNARKSSPLTFYDIEHARRQRSFDCGNCEYRPICSSGCLASDMDDGSGECSGAKMLFNSVRDIIANRVKY